MKRTGIIILILIFYGVPACAQRLVFNDYSWLHKTVVNPAYSGIDENLILTLSANKQWIGMPNAPSTQLLSLQGKAYTLGRNDPKAFLPRPVNEHVGLGLLLYHDENGPESFTGGQLAYAYHFKVTKKYRMSLGLAFTLLQYVLKESDFKPYDVNDPLITWGNDPYYDPDFNVGWAFYQPDKFRLGLAFSGILGLNHNPEASTIFQHRNIFLTANYNFSLGYFGNIEPSLLIRSADNYGTLFETGVKLMYHNLICAQVVYRHKESVITSLGILFNRLTVGYDFDCSLSKIMKSSLGSHGIFTSYKF